MDLLISLEIKRKKNEGELSVRQPICGGNTVLKSTGNRGLTMFWLHCSQQHFLISSLYHKECIISKKRVKMEPRMTESSL